MAIRYNCSDCTSDCTSECTSNCTTNCTAFWRNVMDFKIPGSAPDPSTNMTSTAGMLNSSIRVEELLVSSEVATSTILGMILCFFSLITIVGNAMVLHAVRTERKLQTVCNMFIVSLAIADLTVGLIVMPISTVYIFTDDWLFGVAVCQFWIGVDYTASTASILNLFILSLDRYWSVTNPLRYLSKRTKRRGLILISLVWMVSALWIVPIVAWHHFVNDGVRLVPPNICETEYATNTILKVITSIFNFFLPLAVMYALYTKIFMEIRHRSQLEVGQRVLFSGRKLSVGSFEDLSYLDYPEPRFDNETEGSGQGTPRGRDSLSGKRRSLWRKLLSRSDRKSKVSRDGNQCKFRLPSSVEGSENLALDEPNHHDSKSPFMPCANDSLIPTRGQDNWSKSNDAVSNKIQKHGSNINGEPGKLPDQSKPGETRVGQENRNETMGAILVRVSCDSSGSCDSCNDLGGCCQKSSGAALDSAQSLMMIKRTQSVPVLKIIQGEYSSLESQQFDLTPDGDFNADVTAKDGVMFDDRGIPASSNQDCDVFSENPEHAKTASSDDNLFTKRNSVRFLVEPIKPRPFPVADLCLSKEIHPSKNRTIKRSVSSSENDKTCGLLTASPARPSYYDVTSAKPENQTVDSLGKVVTPTCEGRCFGEQFLSPATAVIRTMARKRKKQHVSSKSAALYKEIKAARQLGVIMGAFTVCFLPYFICFTVVAFCDWCVGGHLMTAVTWIGYLNSTLNPFLYPLCNLNFRRKFRQMLRIK